MVTCEPGPGGEEPAGFHHYDDALSFALLVVRSKIKSPNRAHACRDWRMKIFSFFSSRLPSILDLVHKTDR
jgi:hypothetical protein